MSKLNVNTATLKLVNKYLEVTKIVVNYDQKHVSIALRYFQLRNGLVILRCVPSRLLNVRRVRGISRIKMLRIIQMENARNSSLKMKHRSNRSCTRRWWKLRSSKMKNVKKENKWLRREPHRKQKHKELSNNNKLLKNKRLHEFNRRRLNSNNKRKNNLKIQSLVSTNYLMLLLKHKIRDNLVKSSLKLSQKLFLHLHNNRNQ